MVDNEALVRVKFYLSSPNGTDSSGKPIGRRTLDYIIDPDIALEMLEDVRNENAVSLTICAKRFSHGGWVDVMDTVILANVSWIEWPVDILYRYEEMESE